MSDDLVRKLRLIGTRASYRPLMYHTAADRIEALTAERDQLYERWNDCQEKRMAAVARADTAEAERDALTTENRRLREALKPFADEAEHWESWGADDSLVEWFPEYDGNENPITVGDLRNARAALKGEQK